MPQSSIAATRDQALREVHLPSDPLDLALHHADDLSEEDLAAMISDRRAVLATRRQEWQHQRERAAPWLHGLEPMTFEHTLTRLQAEIDWHDRLLKQLPNLLAHTDSHRSDPTEEQPCPW